MYFGSMTVEERVLLVIDEAIAVVELEGGMSTSQHELRKNPDGQTVIRLSGVVVGVIGTAFLTGLVTFTGMVFSIPALDTRLANAEGLAEKQVVAAASQEKRIRQNEEDNRVVKKDISTITKIVERFDAKLDKAMKAR